MSIPILRQGEVLVACLPGAVTDAELDDLRMNLAERVGRTRARGLLLDVTALDVLDSYSSRILIRIVQVARLRGARSVLVGISPDVAFAMVQLGVTLEGVATALDFEEGMTALHAALERSVAGAR
jgi:rsbT antagonist protein RsbS